jgi:branched-chain amino acid transport system permease protein
MNESTWKMLRIGLLGSIVVLYISLVGLVGTFGQRPIVSGVISLGHALLILTTLIAGYAAAQNAPEKPAGMPVLAGVLAGLLTGGALSALLVIGNAINLRAIFLNASPVLYGLLTLDRGMGGAWIPAVGGIVVGGLAGLTYLLPHNARRIVIFNLLFVLALGLFAGLLRTQLIARPGALTTIGRYLFASEGLTVAGALLTIGLVSAVMILSLLFSAKVNQRAEKLPANQKKILRWAFLGFLVFAALILPQISGPFVAQVIVVVGLFALMGLGLNLELGFAGLLDLGFVAFFAIGAYTVGVLTSLGEYGIAHWSFWSAVPVAVFLALIAGILLGIPVLGIRGDYLAIATLGFGEITRLLVGSDFLRPWLGGSQGVLQIPKPSIGSFVFSGPQQIYYLVVASAVLVAFVAWRLRDSRLGRTWMAIREDEDVAEALGINLFQSKLLAYGLGAAFAGLSGAIFAILVSSVFPHDMQLLKSINVVALIVVGGMGSIPGVIVGALALIGLPELFREFSEYRYLFYGVALIAMMLFRPEGLWPSAAIQRELHAAEEADANLVAPSAQD